MSPSSSLNEPAMALSRVDLPEPLPPRMTRKAPSGSSRLSPRRARTSLAVPGLKVLRRWLTVSMQSLSQGVLRSVGRRDCGRQFFVPAKQERYDQGREYKEGSDQLEVVGIEAPAQGDGHEQTE